MTRAQLEAEIMYHASIAPFIKMRDSGIISDDDLAIISTILRAKYGPIFVGNIVSN